MTRFLFIVNPAGAGGATPEKWRHFQAHWQNVSGGAVAADAVALTTGPGSAQQLAARAAGFDVLVAVGGDGTVGEVASGIMDRAPPAPGSPRPRLGVVPAGAGNDIAKSLGTPTLAAAARALQAGRGQAFDLVRVDATRAGQPLHRHAMIYANAGFSSAAMATPFLKRLLGGKAAYSLAIFLQVLKHRSPVINFSGAGQAWQAKKWTVMIANLEYAGGGAVRIAPNARCDDGDMKVTLVPDRPKIEMLLRVLPKIAAGRHIDEPDFEYFSATEVCVSSAPQCAVEVDGDSFGTTPATFTLCPQAIEVISK